MEKLYVVVRRDLEDGPQAVQSGHAAVNFVMEHPEIGARWFRESNTLAYLSVPDERSLLNLIRKAKDRGVRLTIFQEPDMDNQTTAIALEPGIDSSRICKNLPLTLA